MEALTFDAPTRSVRAVIGFPGAASFGPALLDSLDFASVAPLQSYGIVFENGKCLFVSGLGSKTISTVAIAGVTHVSGRYRLVRERIAGRPLFPRWRLVPNHSRFSQRSGGRSFSGRLIAGRVAFTAVAVDAPGKQIVVAVSGDNGACLPGRRRPVHAPGLHGEAGVVVLLKRWADALRAGCRHAPGDCRDPRAATVFRLWRCRE